jgi:outer membrane protease
MSGAAPASVAVLLAALAVSPALAQPPPIGLQPPPLVPPAAVPPQPPPALVQPPPPPAARPWTVELGAEAAYLSGDTTYRIEASDGVSSVASELEFPVDVGGVGLRARLARARPPGRGGPAFEARGFVNLRQGRGTLKDSDWLSGPAETGEVGAPHEGKDIYSESKVWLHAGALDVRAAWELDALAPGVVLAPILGVSYARLEYVVGDGRQWGYGPWDTPAYTGSWSGRALEYRVSYLVPYLGGRAAISRGALRAHAELWGSPIARANDVDDHLLRGKRSETDASGTAWSATVGAGVRVGPRDTVSGEASLVRVRADGTQVQTFYAGPDAGLRLRIPSEITSSRLGFFLVYAHAL